MEFTPLERCALLGALLSSALLAMDEDLRMDQVYKVIEGLVRAVDPEARFVVMEESADANVH